MTTSSVTGPISVAYSIILRTQAECNLLIAPKGKPLLINKDNCSKTLMNFNSLLGHFFATTVPLFKLNTYFS